MPRQLSVDFWSALAPIYDEIYPFVDDLDFWLRFVKRWQERMRTMSPRIAELGSGTGRVGVHLAQNGYSVDCIENSPGMIEILRKKAAATRNGSVRVVRGDFTRPRVGRTYDMMICPFNTWATVLDRGERKAALMRLVSCLSSGGVIALDLWFKDLTRLQPRRWNLWDYEEESRIYPPKRESLTWCEYTLVNPTERLERIDVNAKLQRGSESFPVSGSCFVRLFTPNGIRRECSEAGLRLVELHGGYLDEEFKSTSQQMVVVLTL